jgi:hypothetical protein
MNNVVSETNLYLNTKERDVGSTITNPKWTLTLPITLSGDRNYFNVALKSIDVPYSWNQLVDASVSYIWAGTPYTVPLVDGNYNILNCLELLRQALLANGAFTLDFTYDYNTFRVSLKSTPAVTVTASKIFAEMLGFDNPVIAIPSASYLVSTQLVNVNPSRSLYVTSSLSTARNRDTIHEPYAVSHVISRFGITTPPGTYISQYFQNPTVSVITDSIISELSLYLSTEYTKIITVLLDWSCTIIVQEIRPPEGVVLGNYNRDNIRDSREIATDLQQELYDAAHRVKLNRQIRTSRKRMREQES